MAYEWAEFRDIIFPNATTPWRWSTVNKVFIATVRKWFDENDFEHADCEQFCQEWRSFVLFDTRMILLLEVDAFRVVRHTEYDACEVRSLEYIMRSALLWEEQHEVDDEGTVVTDEEGNAIVVLPEYSVPCQNMKINILASDPAKYGFPDDWLEWSFYVNVCESTFGRVEIVTRDQLYPGLVGHVTYALNQRHFGWWIY
jgi:hypothetical protein